MAAEVGQVPARYLAILRAVAAGGAELTVSCAPAMAVGGRWVCDQAATAELVRHGLVEAAAPGAVGERVPVGLSRVGAAVLAVVGDA
jgi:hypothetical protein